MTSLLKINSSMFSQNGVSSRLVDEIEKQLTKKYLDLNIITRDLAKDAVPHLDSEWINAISTAKENRDLQQHKKADYSDRLIEEVKQADILLIAAPMYNFSVPSVLKAWFDHIARAGVTFKYTDNGPVGLLKNKTVYLITTRGGIHKDLPSDTQIPFIFNFLNFIGISNIKTVYAEGLNLSGDYREKSITQAQHDISELVAA